MRIVVFSDSHRHSPPLDRIVRAHPDAWCFLHLGDGALDLEALRVRHPNHAFRGVRGNNDWSTVFPESDMLCCEGKRIFFTHGHTFRVKLGLDDLERYARGLGADIALFGHTHTPFQDYRGGLYMMNPGSVAHPLSGKPSYGFVDITGAGVVTNIVYL